MQMMFEIIQENAFVIFMGAIGMFGCFLFGVAGRGLERLCAESCQMTSTNEPFIRQLKLRRENGMRINVSVHNTEAFVLKNMEKYKYLNMSVKDYLRAACLVQLVCIMLGLAGGVINENVWYTIYGFVCAAAISLVGKIEDLEGRERQIVVNMVDYFDNVLSFDKKVVETEGNEVYNKSEEDSLKQQKQSAYVPPAMSEEDKRLVDEVLKEYLT